MNKNGKVSDTSTRGILAVLGMVLLGCRGYDRTPPMSAPAVTVELQNLTEQERNVLMSFLEGEARRRWRVEAVPGSGSRDGLAYRIHLRAWEEQKDLHAQLVSLRAGPGAHVILQNHRSTATLQYTSSQARSHSTAVVTISVVPPEAELVFDSPVPQENRAEAVMSKNGSYRIELPFSFIKSYDYIYFHSVFKGQYRYYRYHLLSQRQEPLPQVDGPSALNRYRSGQR